MELQILTLALREGADVHFDVASIPMRLGDTWSATGDTISSPVLWKEINPLSNRWSTIGATRDAEHRDARIEEREDDIAARDLAHELVQGVAPYSGN